ncbi:hypothetical protein M8C21_023490 [Ambrosia artemisiifolia]|uniref:Uncharacterized protein n=1 Tax=Ambrosia artemisiifolia TaxID=4212 RepID=A0AAD5D402_AMBAR|nr:hypothetical protein M8C21_023490 [Ambrosia artemisiifolia]
MLKYLSGRTKRKRKQGRSCQKTRMSRRGNELELYKVTRMMWK